LPFGEWLPHHPHVPSLSFHPTPTVYSTRRSVGLLHPTADYGIRHVSDPARKQDHSQWRRPFEAFPSLTAMRCCHLTFPLAVCAGNRRCCHLQSLAVSLRDLSSQGVRCALSMLPSTAARCSHGLRPDLMSNGCTVPGPPTPPKQGLQSGQSHSCLWLAGCAPKSDPPCRQPKPTRPEG
jgi:hypothetical protein